jgi:hypothetical protein
VVSTVLKNLLPPFAALKKKAVGSQLCCKPNIICCEKYKMWVLLKTTRNTGNHSVISPSTLLFRFNGDKLYAQKFDEGY